ALLAAGPLRRRSGQAELPTPPHPTPAPMAEPGGPLGVAVDDRDLVLHTLPVQRERNHRVDGATLDDGVVDGAALVDREVLDLRHASPLPVSILKDSSSMAWDQ